MERTTGPADGAARFANIFVVVALVAMLIGAILIISARETFVVDLEPGESETLFSHEVPAWEAVGSRVQVMVLSPGNFTVAPDPEGVPDEVVIRIEDTKAGDVVEEQGNGSIRLGGVIWQTTADAGDAWEATVTNHGEGLARVSATVESLTAYAGGGVLVAVGVLGFVAYRMGIRHSGA